MRTWPQAARPAKPVETSLAPSPALSILGNSPKRFKGRRMGLLVSDGVDAKLLKALTDALAQEGATFKLVAPMVGGVEASDGRWVDAHEKIDGGPSVLFDAVAVLVSDDGAASLMSEPAVRDFLADAYAHLKFIGYVSSALPVLDKAGVRAAGDGGIIDLGNAKNAASFVQACRALRYWDRLKTIKNP